MSGEHTNLSDFVLASTKMHVASNYATMALRRKLTYLEKRLAGVDPTPSAELQQALAETEENIDEAIDSLNDRTDELINALERFANG